MNGNAVAPESLVDRFPGLDFSDVLEAGWKVIGYGEMDSGGWTMRFQPKDDIRDDNAVTAAGENPAQALHSFRKFLWNQGLLGQRNASSPEDIRAKGWMVAVHNDYHLHGQLHTCWLFRRGNQCVKGEGESDAEALDQVRAQLQDSRAFPHEPGDPA